MLKLFSQLDVGQAFVDMFGGELMWTKVDATSAKCIDPDASEYNKKAEFSGLEVCSFNTHWPSKDAWIEKLRLGGYQHITDDWDAKQWQMDLAKGSVQDLPESPFVDMAKAYSDGRLFAFDPYDPTRDYGFVVSAKPTYNQHADATVWVVDALGRKEPLNGATPVVVWCSEFSDPYLVPEADALIKALYDEQNGYFPKLASKEQAVGIDGGGARPEKATASRDVLVSDLAEALKTAAAMVDYLRPERFDDEAHEREFNERLEGWARLTEIALPSTAPQDPPRKSLEAGDKVFVISQQKLATVLNTYGGEKNVSGEIRVDLCGNTPIENLELYDSEKHSKFDATFIPIRAEWKKSYGITKDIPLRQVEDDGPSP
jgi:hypothetical protein